MAPPDSKAAYLRIHRDRQRKKLQHFTIAFLVGIVIAAILGYALFALATQNHNPQ